jgi:hypothetical protein
MLFRRERHPKNSQLVRKTHRITGVIVAAMLLIVSSTGIILNHAEDIDLDSYVPGFLAGIYFSPSDQVNGYVANEHYFFVLSEELYVDSTRVRYCGSDLGGVARFEYGYQILCDGSILWLDMDLNVVDWLTEAAGLPGQLQSIVSFKDDVLVSDGDKTYLVDIEVPAFKVVDVSPPKSGTIQIPAEVLMEESVSWHKLILDFHSGRVFGTVGKYASDLLALAFILMAITGLMIWTRRI